MGSPLIRTDRISGMLVRVDSVKSFRGFQAWACSRDVADFTDINAVYGFNGSGKSTLCALLSQAPSDESWKSGLTLTVTDTGTRRSVTTHTDPFWRRLRVFNRDYVEANLKFDENVPEAVQLLVLGKEQISTEKRRDSLQGALLKAESRAGSVRQKKAQTEAESTALRKTTANKILDAVKHLGGKYTPRSFNAGTIRRRLEAAPDAPANVDLNDLLRVVHEPPLAPLIPPTISQFSVLPLVERINAVLAATVESQVISDLKDHPEWNRWVQEGVILHGDRDECIYCTNPISGERKADLARHFDDSLFVLQRRIDEALSELQGIRTDCARAVADLPADELIDSELRTTYSNARLAVQLSANQLSQAIDIVSAALEAKRNSLFASMDPPPISDDCSVTMTDLVNLINAHNGAVESTAERKQQAAERIELYHIASIRNQIAAFATVIDQLERRERRLNRMQDRFRSELSTLASGELDPVPIAESLNGDLGQLLGRSDLQFTVTEESSGYRITRSGEPAINLSEGERTAIALLYFLRSLETHNTELSRSTVVIDDPVSSLDRSALIGLSSHLWYRLASSGTCRQVILFTHNFELFRQWLVLMRKKPRRQVFELRRRFDREKFRWSFELASWESNSPLERQLSSEYQYLFWRIANSVLEAQDGLSLQLAVEAESLLANACRQMLEMFLGFKEPELLGEFHRQVGGAAGPSSAMTRERIIRFCGDRSHGTYRGTSSPGEGAEGVPMLVVVLDFIRLTDSNHFGGMCRALGIAEPRLCAAFPTDDVSAGA